MRLLQVCGANSLEAHRDRTMLRLLLDTGARRRAEMADLQLIDID
jgi:site-specific recombinase XerD